MNTHFSHYYWKMGKPYGLEPVETKHEISYKIVTDPYHKRYSIEKYRHGQFEKIIYDSIFLDFRHLKPIDQLAWQRECLVEHPEKSVFLLRNAEDRVVLTETQFFEGNWCRRCVVNSAHGISLSTHRMYYKAFDDPFDGVVLYDAEDQPVMMKTYEVDKATGEFTELLTEEWNMQQRSELLNFRK